MSKQAQSPSAHAPVAVSRRRRWGFRLATLGLGLGAALLFLEIGLRIYNPFGCPLKGDKIDLPVYKRAIYHVPPGDDRFDEPVYHYRNSLGFRGNEPPADFKDWTTIVAVGGSTTECRLLTEGKTWPDLLGKRLAARLSNVWINNAGMDGHSTHGHLLLVEDYLVKLKPKYVLFLVGTNDVGREDLNYQEFEHSSQPGPLRRFATCFETYNTIVNLQRHFMAMDKGLTHQLKTNDRDGNKHLSPEYLKEKVAAEAQGRLGFRDRLVRLVRLCRDAGIEPVLITQPTRYESAAPGAKQVTEQNVYRATLESYNDVTKAVAAEKKIFVVDLSAAISGEPDTFYDMSHYTKLGAERAAEVLSRELTPFLMSRAGRNPVEGSDARPAP